MRDQIDATIWNEGHEQFSRDLHAFFVKLAAGFARLQAIRFEAPWRSRGRGGPGLA
jgi:hypothetical protein